MTGGIATSRDGLPTIKWELVEDDANEAIHLDYEIIGPFVTKGERRRQSWCWSQSYPKHLLVKEAHEAAGKIARGMWGEA